MLRDFIFASLIVAHACTSCQPGSTLSESKRDEIKAQVEQMLKDYFRATKRDGLLAEFKYLDHSAEFYWIPPGYSSWISYDSVATVLRNTAPALRSIENRWKTLRVDPLSADHATFSGKLTSTSVDTTGQVTTVSLLETGVVVKREDGWKLLRGQTVMLPEG